MICFDKLNDVKKMKRVDVSKLKRPSVQKYNANENLFMYGQPKILTMCYLSWCESIYKFVQENEEKNHFNGQVGEILQSVVFVTIWLIILGFRASQELTHQKTSQ